MYELLNITTQHRQLVRCKQTNSKQKTQLIANNVVLKVIAIILSIFMS